MTLVDWGQLLFVLGLAFTVIGIPLPLIIRYGDWHIGGAVGPVLIVIGGLLW